MFTYQEEDGKVSIHTPTKGVTPRLPLLLVRVFVSIHTPTKGVTNNYADDYGER